MVSCISGKKGVTVVEIIIVILISSIIMGIGMAMMSRNNVQFKKSNDLISIQRLMDNIVERIRSDVRSLKRVKSYSKNGIKFVIVKDLNEAMVEYKYDPDEKTLYRSEEGVSLDSDFHGSKQIMSMTFNTDFVDDEDIEEQEEVDNGTSPAEKREFKSLSIAMQIAANEYRTSSKKTDISTLSIACQFYSTCVESEFRISKLKNIKD